MLTLTVAEAGRGTRNASEAAKRIAPRILFLIFIDASLGTSMKRATRMPCRKPLNQRAFAPPAPVASIRTRLHPPFTGGLDHEKDPRLPGHLCCGDASCIRAGVRR